jgi:Ca2+-binding EF-hand superfamily protein
MALDRQKLKALFERFDANQDGAIDEGEFAELLRALDFDMSAGDRLTAFRAIDITSNQRIEFGEFAEWWSAIH